MIKPEASPLVELLHELDLVQPLGIPVSKISNVCLKASDEDRVYRIPYLCDCVWNEFHKRCPVYDNRDEVDWNKVEIYQLLEKVIHESRSGCTCHSKSSEDLNGFGYIELNETDIDQWSDEKAFLEKRECELCDGSGKNVTVHESACHFCDSNGYIVDKESKDAHLCSECRGKGSFKQHNSNKCEQCDGLGIIPKVWFYQQSDIDCPHCGGERFIECGAISTDYSDADEAEISCSNCDGVGNQRDDSRIFESSYSKAEWKLLSLIQMGFLVLHEGKTDEFIHVDDIRSAVEKHPYCPLSQGLHQKFSEYIDLPEFGSSNGAGFRGIEFEITVINGSENSGPTIDLEAYVSLECEECLDSGSLGIPCSTCAQNYYPNCYAKPGTVGVYRLKDLAN